MLIVPVYLISRVASNYKFVVNVDVVVHVIFQSLSAHPFIQSQFTQICSLTHSQPTQTNNQLYLNSIL